MADNRAGITAPAVNNTNDVKQFFYGGLVTAVAGAAVSSLLKDTDDSGNIRQGEGAGITEDEYELAQTVQRELAKGKIRRQEAESIIAENKRQRAALMARRNEKIESPYGPTDPARFLRGMVGKILRDQRAKQQIPYEDN